MARAPWACGSNLLQASGCPLLVEGYVLRNRTFRDREVCHLAKKTNCRIRGPWHRYINGPNYLIFPALLFPPKNNGTRFSTVLMIT